MNRVAMTALLKMVLPDHTIRWCDGGFFNLDGEIYRSEDDTFGTIGGVDALREGVGDEVPALTMTVLPPDTNGAAILSHPGNQTARAIFMLAEYDYDTGEITSSDVQYNGQIDQCVLTRTAKGQSVNMSIVSLAERLFEGNIGNTLNPTFHKSVWPGETGHDQATGLAVAVAWGTEKPVAGASSYGGGFDGGYGPGGGYGGYQDYQN